MKGIGERLKQVRKSTGLNQGEFAQKIGISQSMLSGIEGEREILSDRNSKLICLTFDVNEIWLRTGKGEMFNKIPHDAPLVDNLTPDEREFIGIYQQLTDPNKEVARATVNALLNAQIKSGEAAEPGDPPGIGPRMEDGKAG